METAVSWRFCQLWIRQNFGEHLCLAGGRSPKSVGAMVEDLAQRQQQGGPQRTEEQTGLRAKRSLDSVPSERAVRLKWVTRRKPGGNQDDCNALRLVLESFEVVPLPQADVMPSPQTCVAAASLLANLVRVPPSSVIIADVPLPMPSA